MKKYEGPHLKNDDHHQNNDEPQKLLKIVLRISFFTEGSQN